MLITLVAPGMPVEQTAGVRAAATTLRVNCGERAWAGAVFTGTAGVNSEGAGAGLAGRLRLFFPVDSCPGNRYNRSHETQNTDADEQGHPPVPKVRQAISPAAQGPARGDLRLLRVQAAEAADDQPAEGDRMEVVLGDCPAIRSR